MSEVVLSVEKLVMHFGGIKALSDASLKVHRNSIFALIGPNGAGKTTVFNCLTGFYKASGGKIELNVRGEQTNVIDEPAAGLNPQETEALSAMIRLLRDEHDLTVVLIEHDMGMVMSISDHIVVLDHGIVIAEGGPDAIRNDPKVIAAYLGADEEEVVL